MSGSHQHHLPRFLLRAFRSSGGTKSKSKVWVFQQRKEPELRLVKEVAAETHFYSELSTDGAPTLDDKITEYELVVASKYHVVRAMPPGGVVPSEVAAEIVTHLTIRSAHFRTTMVSFMANILAKGADIVGDEKKVRPFLGIDTDTPSNRFLEAVDKQLEEYPQALEMGIPREVLHRMGFMLVKEQFNRTFLQGAPLLALAIKNASDQAPESASRAHNEALLRDLAPDQRAAKLRNFIWTTISAPVGGAILPDCVALALEEGGAFQSLMLSDLDKIDIVLMPLASDKILVGQKAQSLVPDILGFNRAAASCSKNFFVSARDGDDLSKLSFLIGEHPTQFVDAVTSSSLDELLRLDQRASRGLVAESQSATSCGEQGSVDQCDEEFPRPEFSYSINFHGCVDEEGAERIAAILRFIVLEVHKSMPVDLLEGITFSTDRDYSLRNLDRGFENILALISGGEVYEMGVAMTFVVWRAGDVKWHVIIQGDVGHYLISDNEEKKKHAIHVVIYQLALTGFMQAIEKVFPGSLLRPFSDHYEAFIYPCVHCAWSGYLAARASPVVSSHISGEYRRALLDALERMDKNIPLARLAYRFDGNLNVFLQVALSAVGDVLLQAGKALGHFGGLGSDLLEDEALRSAFERLGLQDWMLMFDGELSELWLRRGCWSSFSEFTSFSRHTERLLWQYGVIPYRTEDNQVHVEIPLATDAAVLAAYGAQK